MGWTTLPRNYLEEQFDSLGLEHNFETGIKDTSRNVEKLGAYPDPEEDARCAASLEVLTSEDQILRHRSAPVVRCHTCGQTVYTTWRTRAHVWVKLRHHIPD